MVAVKPQRKAETLPQHGACLERRGEQSVIQKVWGTGLRSRGCSLLGCAKGYSAWSLIEYTCSVRAKLQPAALQARQVLTQRVHQGPPRRPRCRAPGRRCPGSGRPRRRSTRSRGTHRQPAAAGASALRYCPTFRLCGCSGRAGMSLQLAGCYRRAFGGYWHWS